MPDRRTHQKHRPQKTCNFVDDDPGVVFPAEDLLRLLRYLRSQKRQRQR